MENVLSKDIEAFEKELPNLSGELGKFAVFFEGKLLGTFAAYDEALTKGYETAGLKPFLVQQILQVPQIQHFSRSIGFECLTSS